MVFVCIGFPFPMITFVIFDGLAVLVCLMVDFVRSYDDV